MVIEEEVKKENVELKLSEELIKSMHYIESMEDWERRKNIILEARGPKW